MKMASEEYSKCFARFQQVHDEGFTEVESTITQMGQNEMNNYRFSVREREFVVQQAERRQQRCLQEEVCQEVAQQRAEAKQEADVALYP